ncbi:hypothetical protein CXB51_002903 [Gossypium anomalum]|uniref:Uncharacterized protein n=1 Tax=Gossypium anomalum TaxID=47600 RepID=A0A8J5ZP65_9ROSI|nr:hypothetical protein CXB51_002903 [Gossypium anomalum]
MGYVPNTKGNVACKLYGKAVKGGITRFKEHIDHKTSNVAPCPNVTGVIRESMMNILKESNTKKINKKRRTDEFLSQLIGKEDEHKEFIDEVSAIRQATRETIQSQHSDIEGKNSDEVLVIGITFMKKGDLLMDQLENIMEKEQVNPSQEYTQGKQILRPALTQFATHFIQLEEITRQKQGLREMFNSKLLLFRDKHETFGTPQAQRAWKQMNPDGENVGVLLVDTSNDEMDVDQSQQQNLSYSSFSSMPSQSGDGPDGGGLSPIDEDDGRSGDRGEIKFSSRYGGEYGVGTTSGHLSDRSEFDGNMFPEPRRDRSEPKAPSKGKGKKHTSVGSSSGRRLNSSNLGYSDSSTNTQGFYPSEQPSYFQPSHSYP